jgi:hypothetical protein
MPSEAPAEKPGGNSPGLLRTAALIALPAGAAGSVALLLWAGRRNNSILLMVLFTLWVLSPYAALLVASVISKRWSALTRTTLYSLMLVVALGSLAIYGGDALGPPRAKAAFFFVVVPPASWLLIAIALPIAARVSGRISRRGARA